MAEIELNVLIKQCLDSRIDNIATVKSDALLGKMNETTWMQQ